MSGPHATNASMKPLRKGWEWIPLGKYVENHDGRRIPISKKERESRSGSFPYYGASGVIDTIDGFTHDGEFLLIGEDGANLLTRSKPLAFLTKGKVWVNNHAHVLRCKPGYSNAYLAYFINSIDLSQYVTGTAQPKLSQSMMNKILIPVAPPEQQVEIVAELEKQFSRLDEAVANLKRVKANLKRYRNSVLQVVTGGELSLDGTGASDVTQWRWLTVEELASKEPRSIQSGPFGSNLKHSEFQSTGKLVIGIDNVQDGRFSLGSNHRISEVKFTELAKYAARPRDVLITVMATIGRVCVVPADIEEAIITKHVYRITVDKNVVIPEYFGIALRGSKEVRTQLMDSVQGQTRPGLNGGLIKKIRVPIPPLLEQHRIVAEIDRRLSLVRGVEAEVDANLKRAQALRQSTLSKAFSNG